MNQWKASEQEGFWDEDGHSEFVFILIDFQELEIDRLQEKLPVSKIRSFRFAKFRKFRICLLTKYSERDRADIIAHH